jgi:hypothetical protein
VEIALTRRSVDAAPSGGKDYSRHTFIPEKRKVAKTEKDAD